MNYDSVGVTPPLFLKPVKGFDWRSQSIAQSKFQRTIPLSGERVQKWLPELSPSSGIFHFQRSTFASCSPLGRKPRNERDWRRCVPRDRQQAFSTGSWRIPLKGLLTKLLHLPKFDHRFRSDYKFPHHRGQDATLSNVSMFPWRPFAMQFSGMESAESEWETPMVKANDFGAENGSHFSTTFSRSRPTREACHETTPKPREAEGIASGPPDD